MIKFLMKGLLRDRSRSMLPLLVVAIGVMLSVFVHAYVTGLMKDMVEQTAQFSDGHVKVMTAAYAANENQLPNDLALTGTNELLSELRAAIPSVRWEQRIRFGGLIDVPDSVGETRSQGPAMGIGIDLFTPGSDESGRFNLDRSLVSGTVPSLPGEVLLSDDFARRLQVDPGETVTLIGSTMNGEMSFYNFTVSGTVRFGNTGMDRGTVIADISDVQNALDMYDSAGEILGFFDEGYYDDEFAAPVVTRFRELFPETDDEFRPVIIRLRDIESMKLYIDLSNSMGTIITVIFMIAMSLVLWNAGLLGGLRRYGEVGIRLAIGEEKGHIYRSMIYESVMIGIAGTVVGTAFGLFFAWLMQEYGLDIGEFTKNTSSSVLMPNIVRARITPPDFYLGFIPGVLSTLIGTMLSGIGIYKRQTSQLFKELEA
jgi:putative ABC transport system permease protein